MSNTSFRTFARESARAALTAALCVTMAVPEALAADLHTSKPKHTAPLTKNERTLHALNRFTFGPRPGDVDAVNAMGLDAWFQKQLHPETIDDAALDKRLDEFPAMKLSPADLIQRFPSPQYVRAMMVRDIDKAPENADPTEKAIYANYIARYKAALAAKAKGSDLQADAKAGKEAASSGNEMMAGSGDASRTAPKSDAERQSEKQSKLVTAAFEKQPVATITNDQIREIVQLPPNERFERIVALNPADNIRFTRAVGPHMYEVLRGFTPEQREVFAAMQDPVRVVSTEALGERILRNTYSERQLQAVMTDFWLNHFSVYVRKNNVEPYLLNSYERDAVLPQSLGNFEKLLIANAESPAMLMYLDNWESIGPHSEYAQKIEHAKMRHPGAPFITKASQGINENYARELMELHTVGVNGGYTQKDVIEVAKCFTGWTVSRPFGYVDKGGDEGGVAAFRFDPSRHEPGPKTVLGVTIPEGGMQEGLTVIHMLATNPHTAQFISKKLAVRFVSDNPPRALVDRMAASFLKSNGDIKAVMSTMYHSPEFWSPAVYRSKVKTPIEFMVSALRASNASIQSPIALIQAAERLGMPVYGMLTPNGYSWKSEDWVSSGDLVNRMNFSLVLAGDDVLGADTNWQRLLGVGADSTTAASPSPEVEKKLEHIILGAPASPKTRATVLEQFKTSGMQEAAAKALEEQPKKRMASGTDPMENEAGNGMMKQVSEKQVFQSPYRKKETNSKYGFSFFQPNNQPETPLDTMAGLLIGSPDFQLR